MDYLLKTEPSEYSFADLERDQSTVWDGVSNPVALKNLRAMKPGDRLVIYETGDHKSAVGTATVVSADISDARNPRVKIKQARRWGAQLRWQRSKPTSCLRILRWCGKDD